MRQEHWIMLAAAGGLLALLLCAALSARPRSGLFRWGQRIFWALSLLLFSGALGGPGVNLWNAALTALLGLPGFAALWAVSLL